MAKKEFEAFVVGGCLIGAVVLVIFALSGVIGLLMIGSTLAIVYFLCKDMIKTQGQDPTVEGRKDLSVT